VLVHELGHFATAKWARMKVTEYFVGFGPVLWSVRRGETTYGVKAFPLGGYVKIPGMSNLEEIDPQDEERTYRRQPFHKRLIVVSAGSFMHFVMAFILAWIAVIAFGVPNSSRVQVAGFSKWKGHSQTAAQLAGLQVGDQIDAVNGKPIQSETQLGDVIQHSPDKAITLGVLRAGRQITLRVVPQLGHLSKNTETIGAGKGKAVGLIGIEESPQAFSSEGPLRALGTAGANVGSITSLTFSGFGHIFSPHSISSLLHQVTNPHAASQAAKNPKGSDRVLSIVGAARVATQAEQAGILYLLGVLIALNIAFGILNMVPMLPLDGGHVAIAVYERIRTRRGRTPYQADVTKLLPVVYAFVAVLVLIVGSALFLDIAHPIANPF
jgi:membrane-associated protease RseP (regulator of RpoE activity)